MTRTGFVLSTPITWRCTAKGGARVGGGNPGVIGNHGTVDPDGVGPTDGRGRLRLRLRSRPAIRAMAESRWGQC